MNNQDRTCFFLLIFAASALRAETLTAPSELSPTNTLITFESFPVELTSNPLVIGNATFSSSKPLTIENISGFPASGTTVFRNVLRPNGASLLGFSGYVDIRLDFAAPVGEVGFGWWDPNYIGNRIEVYSVANVLLETVSIPTFGTGGGFAAFRGIRRASNDISYAIARVSSAGDVYGIDNVSFGTVKDTVAPTVSPPADISVVASGAGGAIVNYPPATATDAGGVISLTYSQNSGTLFAVGTTVVTATATDSANNIGTATFTVTVTPIPAAVFDSWAAGAGLVGADALPAVTPYNDGIANLLKYAFNMNASGPDVSVLTTAGNSGLPQIAVDSTGTEPVLRVEFLRRKGSGLIYTPERSDTLGTFVTMTNPQTVTSIDAQWERVTVEAPVAAQTSPAAFARVRVTLP